MEQVTKRRNQVIPGLPDEIAMECLIRVPYQFHSNMKSVCHTWQDLISLPSFYQQRQISCVAEQLVLLVQPLPTTTTESTQIPTTTTTTAAAENGDEGKQEEKQHHHHNQEQQELEIHRPPRYALSIYNATHNIWHRTWPQEGIPLFSQMVAIPSSGQVLLLGGWDPITLEPVPHVYVLELIGPRACRWRRGASMAISRSFFACAVVGPSTVYVAGGHDSQKNALRSAEVYEVERDEWRLVPDMVEERDECQGIAWDGDSRFWVVSGYGTESQGQFRKDAECYDPETGCWSKTDGVWPVPSSSPRGATIAVSVNGSTESSKQQQWWWFLGNEQKQQLEQQSGESKEDENKTFQILVNSIPLPDFINGSTPCVTSVGNVHQNGKHLVFVMGGSGKRSSSSSSFGCGDCDGEAFIMERCNSNGGIKWNHVHTPLGFSGFPCSASNLAI